jgi:hypothetical protein
MLSRHRHRRVGNADPALIPQPGETQSLPPPPDSTRMATFAEAFSSIIWAATAALAAAAAGSPRSRR